MKTRVLKDIEVSEVGMGCMAFSHGYGQIPEENYSIEAIRGAYEHGCTLFDTAEVYSPIPGSKNKGRIIENLDASTVDLTDEEFRVLEDALNGLKVYGHRGLGGF